jgi:hypothetical protein
MKRTSDPLISQSLAAPEETWATLPGDLVRLLAGADPSLLPSLFVLSKHSHLSLALAPPMSDFWRDYFYSSLGLSDYVADVTRGLTWKDLVHLKPHLPRTYYAKVARPRFTCGAVRSDRRLFQCQTPGCALFTTKHLAVDWVEEKVRLVGHPLQMPDREVRPFGSHFFGCSKFMAGPYKFLFNESEQSIGLYRNLSSNDPIFSFILQVAVPPSKVDPKDAWKVDKFYGFV